jgi:hypothetical protein
MTLEDSMHAFRLRVLVQAHASLAARAARPRLPVVPTHSQAWPPEPPAWW